METVQGTRPWENDSLSTLRGSPKEARPGGKPRVEWKYCKPSVGRAPMDYLLKKGLGLGGISMGGVCTGQGNEVIQEVC